MWFLKWRLSMLSQEEREEIKQLLREQAEYHRANPAAASTSFPNFESYQAASATFGKSIL